jgi:hypothetical protein
MVRDPVSTWPPAAVTLSVSSTLSASGRWVLLITRGLVEATGVIHWSEELDKEPMTDDQACVGAMSQCNGSKCKRSC